LVVFRSPSGVQTHLGSLVQTGGGTLDGTYSGTIGIPRWVESGTWRVELSFADAVRNSSYLLP
jgi:hypothetical protein